MSLKSAVTTVVVEHRLPYRLEKVWDRVVRPIAPEKVVRADNGRRFRIRRCTWDWAFVANVVNSNEYLRHGITLTKQDNVVDVGGNIGTFAVLASSLARFVITVEPDPANLRLLDQNLDLNFCENVWVEPLAITDHGNGVTLRLADNGGGFNTIMPTRPEATTRTITVCSSTLEDLLNRYALLRIDLLKLDCEGAEFPIFRTMTPSLARRIRQIVMEYHPSGVGTRDELLILITRLGFTVLHEDRFPTGGGGHLFLRR